MKNVNNAILIELSNTLNEIFTAYKDFTPYQSNKFGDWLSKHFSDNTKTARRVFDILEFVDVNGKLLEDGVLIDEIEMAYSDFRTKYSRVHIAGWGFISDLIDLLILLRRHSKKYVLLEQSIRQLHDLHHLYKIYFDNFVHVSTPDILYTKRISEKHSRYLFGLFNNHPIIAPLIKRFLNDIIFLKDKKQKRKEILDILYTLIESDEVDVSWLKLVFGNLNDDTHAIAIHRKFLEVAADDLRTMYFDKQGDYDSFNTMILLANACIDYFYEMLKLVLSKKEKSNDVTLMEDFLSIIQSIRNMPLHDKAIKLTALINEIIPS